MIEENLKFLLLALNLNDPLATRVASISIENNLLQVGKNLTLARSVDLYVLWSKFRQIPTDFRLRGLSFKPVSNCPAG